MMRTESAGPVDGTRISSLQGRSPGRKMGPSVDEENRFLTQVKTADSRIQRRHASPYRRACRSMGLTTTFASDPGRISDMMRSF